MQSQTAHQLHQQGYTPADIYAAVDRGELLPRAHGAMGWTFQWAAATKPCIAETSPAKAPSRVGLHGPAVAVAHSFSLDAV